MSIENSIDRLAAAIESLAAAVLAPVVVSEPVRVEPRPATEAEKAEIAAADATAAKKPRGRPRKAAADAAAPAQTEGLVAQGEAVTPADPPAATQTADTATASDGTTATASAIESSKTSSEPASTAPTTSETTTTGSVETISKADIVQILTGLQKKLEETATSIEEKRAAAQRCRDLIKSVVGTESLKDAKPEHFGRIKSAVLKVLNNE